MRARSTAEVRGSIHGKNLRTLAEIAAAKKFTS